MEPLVIALICAASFGAIVALSVFVRQLILSRDKNLNDEAQRKALALEASELEKMREQMHNNSRFDSHYKILGNNKDAIIYLDTKIEDILKKKAQLVERYSQVSLKESEAIVNGDVLPARKKACDLLKQEIDDEMKFYDSELVQLQKRRTTLWDAQKDMEKYLMAQEKSRNDTLDSIYKQHSGILEKIYVRHTNNTEEIAKQTILAGTSSFKAMIMAPIQFLLQYFNISTGIDLDHSKIEESARENVSDTEDDVNDSETSDEDVKTDIEDNKAEDEEITDEDDQTKSLVV